MKTRYKIIIVALIFGILLYSLLKFGFFTRNQFDVIYERLDNSSEVVGILENTHVNFDSSSKDIGIQGKNATLKITYTSETIFRIWQLKIYQNDKQIDSKERPDVNDVWEGDKKLFRFSYEIKLPENDSIIRMQFSMQNAKEHLPKYLYPFDSYYLFDESKNITNNVVIISHYYFPETDIQSDVSAIAKVPNGKILCETSSGKRYIDFSFQAKPTPIKFDHQLITADIGLVNNQFNGLGISTYIILPNGEWIQLKNCNFSAGNSLVKNMEISFSRTIFPSKFVFFLATILIISIIKKYGSFEYYREHHFWKTLYDMYIVTLTPVVIAEFTVSLLPPSRPLTLTLFDFIFLIPFLWTAKNLIKSKFRYE